jgi:hypothetical protein
MPWLRKNLQNEPLAYKAIFDRFETLFLADGAPRDMVLMEDARGINDLTLWMHVSPKLRSAFPEFEEAANFEKAGNLAFLIGHQEEFEKFK